jgi:hypothetical protein
MFLTVRRRPLKLQLFPSTPGRSRRIRKEGNVQRSRARRFDIGFCGFRIIVGNEHVIIVVVLLLESLFIGGFGTRSRGGLCLALGRFFRRRQLLGFGRCTFPFGRTSFRKNKSWKASSVFIFLLSQKFSASMGKMGVRRRWDTYDNGLILGYS